MRAGNRHASLLVGMAFAALVAAWPNAAQSQSAGQMHRIGIVTGASGSENALRQALKDAGYIEGKNVIIEARSWEGRDERAADLVAELLRLKVDVLVAGSAASALAAKAATATVPIVFASVNDPIAAGIVSNLARPGGNITGATMLISGAGFGGKWIELLKEAVPGIAHVAALRNPENPSSAGFVREMQVAAGRLKLKLDLHDAGDDAQLEKALGAIAASRAQAMIVTGDPSFFVNRTRILRFAESKRLPALYYSRPFVDAGGLMSYGVDGSATWRTAARQVDRILKGAKPGDLPVEQPTRFELAINLKTSRALGLTISPALRLRADRVIE